MRNLTLYTEETILDFGKYEGTNLREVLNRNPDYLKWCVDNVDWFFVEEELLEEIFQNHMKILVTNEGLIEVNDCLSNAIKGASRNINSNKMEKYYELTVDNYDDFNYCDDHDDWMDDIQENWLAYAAGTDDPEVMNDVYWNLD